MRQIKFRAKRMDSNEWLFGSLFVDKKEQCYIKEPNGELYFIEDKDSVGQFTGLKDKNGKEIYEGDILLVKEFENKRWLSMSMEERELVDIKKLKGKLQKKYITPVLWEDGMFLLSADQENDMYFGCLFGNMKHSVPIFDFEVIGNIHDNPELLKR